MSISSIAINHGINANVICKWLPLYRDQPPSLVSALVPVKFAPKRPDEGSVIIDLAIGEQTITLKWPSPDFEGCARFVRELTQ